MSAVRSCLAVVVFACAGLAVGFAFLVTAGMDSPGWQDNTAPMAVALSVVAALLSAGGLALAGRPYGGWWVVVAALGALIALRMWTLAPALHCWSYDSVGRNDDGSYSCGNRYDGDP
ncbi:hypothetical protein [Streptomyces sp. Ru72]|uniref:hypothetical protein n=1 Tax=Streptomyces sp. Ru72 TaxID=2080747 RepID=UPI000CDD17FC|nr:hypothetical protein [Streptomyces sp. Ru72]POX53209.1 hypothetical protein C3488_06075 [Streptomyces sp. Ru72]